MRRTSRSKVYTAGRDRILYQRGKLTKAGTSSRPQARSADGNKTTNKDEDKEKDKDKPKGVRAEMREARAAHEAALAAVDCAHQLALAECIPRFGPLGRDAEGRVYYAVTPGVVEREAAVAMLEGEKGEVRFGKRRGVVEREERKKMRAWSWFVAVWGRKPEGALVAKPEDDQEKREGEEEI